MMTEADASAGTPQLWGPQLAALFNVLVGVAFAGTLMVVSDQRFSGEQIVLTAVILFVLFDTWYNVNCEVRDVRGRGLTGPLPVISYLLALSAYSCLPYLAFAHQAAAHKFSPTSLLAGNLVLICALDTSRRVFYVRGVRKGKREEKVDMTDAGRGQAVTHVFLAFTGVIWSVAFAVLAYILRNPTASAYHSLILAAAWLGARVIDGQLLPWGRRMVDDIYARLSEPDPPAEQ